MMSRLNSALRRTLATDNGVGAALALCAFVMYLTTLAPSIGFTDAGELAAVAATFGIAHPTGYPLFTLVAGVFAKLPLGASVIWKLNLFAALCTALSVFFFHRFFLTVLQLGRAPNPQLESVDPSGQEGGGGGDLAQAAGEVLARAVRRAASAAGALTLAFSRTFWEQSTGVEVYSLHLLMIALVLSFFTQAVSEKTQSNERGGQSSSSRAWWLFALCLGLSFANHMTTVLLLPGLAWLFFATYGFGRLAWLRLAHAVPPFLAGLSLYLYLPLRAAAGPALNWGDPVTWESFLRHVSGRQYSVWMFSSFEESLNQLQVFLTNFPTVFGGGAGLGSLALMAIGCVLMARASRPLFIFTALLFITCVAYAVNYTIHDISTYFLLAYVAAAAWVARGAESILCRGARALSAHGDRSTTTGVWALFALLGAMVFIPAVAMNHQAVDESDNYAVEDYTRNLFASLEPGSTLLTYQWDFFVAAAFYQQIVEGRRTDVIILERELLRRSWYITQLERNHPEVIAASRTQVDAFLAAVRPFERGEPFDGAAIQAAFEAMIASMLRQAAARGPVYATPDVEYAYLRSFTLVPTGLTLRLVPPSSSSSSPTPDSPPQTFEIRPFPKDNHLFRGLSAAYSGAYVNMAWHQGATGNIPAVRPLLTKALAISPEYPPALELLRKLEGR